MAETTHKLTPPPAELAQWARDSVSVGDPLFLVSEFASRFDIETLLADELDRCGQLVLRDGRIVILIRRSTYVRQRFSAAHEMGHYLLAASEGIPLVDQIRDRGYEAYCNAFASHLLLPRPWVRRQPIDPSDLYYVLSVARASQTSLAASLLALNEARSWRRTMIQWRPRRRSADWFAAQVVGAPGHPVVEPHPSTDDVLSGIGPRVQAAVLRLVVDGKPCFIKAESVRLNGSCFSLFRRESLAADVERAGTPKSTTTALPASYVQ